MIALDRISADRKLHMRVEMNEKAVNEYAIDMEAGDVFPPILVFYDEAAGLFRLVDGFHRFAAHSKVFPNAPILCDLQYGTYKEALWAACTVNARHGYRRWRPPQGPLLARVNEPKE